MKLLKKLLNEQGGMQGLPNKNSNGNKNNSTKKIAQPPKPKKRPRKTLWFRDHPYWAQDVKLEYPDAQFFRTEEDEEVAVDGNNRNCYGVYRHKERRGVSFPKGRPLYTVIHPRRKFVQNQ